MLNNEEILEIFRTSGALQEGHFRLTSGRHSDQYIQCAQVLQYPEHTEALCRHLAGFFREDRVDLVIGPAMGGITLSYEMARQLGTPSLFTEREEGQMALRRSFSVPRGARVLVVEDVITTGGSIREVIGLVEAAGAETVGSAVLVDRSAGAVSLGVPRQVSALSVRVESFDPADCPLCRQGLPITKPGSRS